MCSSACVHFSVWTQQAKWRWLLLWHAQSNVCRVALLVKFGKRGVVVTTRFNDTQSPNATISCHVTDFNTTRVQWEGMKKI
jgi:hypothetical protein|mmetsp:Transcript_77265/g.128830  ORF Transcript_77265/g.128830 Transcript_77265/m.128830 type:complete len:81 (+) Transcript_77265:90-332(+)